LIQENQCPTSQVKSNHLPGNPGSRSTRIEKSGDQHRQTFRRQFETRTKKALKSGGPAHAIQVCAEKAPSIAQQLSTETGWMVKRVSLKVRNKQTATPDAWETKVL